MSTASILVVEDEKIIAKGIEKRLLGMGYAVAGLASTGEEAIRKATELRPDVVLMDIHLGPGMDGVEAAGIIRRRENLPVVYLTAHSDDATLQRAKLTEPFGYVLKPYEDRDLQIAIEIGLYKHKMERRLRENEQWLAATLGSIGDGVIATDERGRVRFMNSLAEKLTGWAQADALGRRVAEVFEAVEEKTRGPVPNMAIQALDSGECATLAAGTILISKTGAEHPIDDSAAPIRDVNGNIAGAVLVFRDVTERRRLDEHRRQAQKMEAIARLGGGIAHEFNNVLTIITGFSELLLIGSQPVDEHLNLVRTIHDAGKRAAALTQQIMTFSRKQMLIPCVLNLNTVVQDMATLVKRLVGEHIELVTEAAPDLGEVKADPTQIGQVILNLAANARDAMPDGGKLVLSTANAEVDGRSSPRHPDLKPGRYAVLTVKDTGCGMSEDVLAHAFEPFFTTKEVGKGTGLGLASVYGVVKQSGGHIDVSSQVGVGTTFRVFLPLVEEPKAEKTSPGQRGTSVGNETILLVEDEEAIRRVAQIVLQQRGYTVLLASDGLEALRVAESHPGTIHLLITDLMMPRLSGRMLAERLAPARPSMRVLFMSGYSEDMTLDQGEALAAAEFLRKPFTLAALTSTVREVLDRG
jgi:PAS domain S-box-containing protein